MGEGLGTGNCDSNSGSTGISVGDEETPASK